MLRSPNSGTDFVFLVPFYPIVYGAWHIVGDPQREYVYMHVHLWNELYQEEAKKGKARVNRLLLK